jgi:hypothetical protein
MDVGHIVFGAFAGFVFGIFGSLVVHVFLPRMKRWRLTESPSLMPAATARRRRALRHC